jgi:hypothetical protein
LQYFLSRARRAKPEVVVAKYAESDREDWEVWRAVHDNWAELFSAEIEYRRGRAPIAYSELIESFGGVDAWSSEPRGSSLSQLSTTEAFQRGYQGGWR